MKRLHEDYLSDRLGLAAYERIAQAGLRLLSNELPWFPPNAVVPEVEADPSIWEVGTLCAAAHKLPGVLVTPVGFWERAKGKFWIPRCVFPAYWSGPMRVQCVGDPLPDGKFWRQASAMEILCAIAQHPHVGSLRTADPSWAEDDLPSVYQWEMDHGFSSRATVQAYHMPEREQVVLDWDRSDAFHHRTYVRRMMSGDPYPFKECEIAA